MIDAKQYAPLLEKLGKEGVFLTSGKKPNTMVVSWGSLGVYFRETVFIAPVRVSRYTRELIDTTGVFSISVPSAAQLQALKIFGSETGKTVNKYEKTDIKTKKCKSIDTYAIEGSTLTLECEIIAEMEIDIDSVSDEIAKTFYADDDFHIMYYGKIVNIY